MTTIATKLVKDGNSKAIRLTSTVLAMSGLKDEVELEVKKGQVIIRPLQTKRHNWHDLIALEIARNPKALAAEPELEDWDVTINDGIS